MKVEILTKYKYQNQEFNSLQDLQNFVHDKIGVEVIDKINRVCPPQKHKDLFNLLDVLCSKDVRETLTELLNIEVTIEDEEEEDTVNILDIK